MYRNVLWLYSSLYMMNEQQNFACWWEIVQWSPNESIKSFSVGIYECVVHVKPKTRWRSHKKMEI